MATRIVPRSRLPENTDLARASQHSRWLWLTFPVALLMALVSATGLLVADFYGGSANWRSQTVAQDFIDLVVVLPVLVASAIYAMRGSRRAWLIWLGALSYVVYSFVIYAFAVQYNRLFLAYVAVLGCALWALIGGMAATDWAEIKARFAATTPVKIVALFLLIPAVLFAMLWLMEEVPGALSGDAPQSLKDVGLLTNPVHVLDLTIMLPSMLVAGVWLWRRQTLGYGLAALLLMNGLLQHLAIGTIMVFALRSGEAASAGLAAGFFGFAALTLAVLVWYLRGMHRPTS
jgi:hypothetical protein